MTRQKNEQDRCIGVGLSLTKEKVELLDALALARGVNRSELIRQLIDAAIDLEDHA